MEICQYKRAILQLFGNTNCPSKELQFQRVKTNFQRLLQVNKTKLFMSNSNDIGYIFAFLISGNNLKQTELNSLELLKFKAVKYNTRR